MLDVQIFEIEGESSFYVDMLFTYFNVSPKRAALFLNLVNPNEFKLTNKRPQKQSQKDTLWRKYFENDQSNCSLF
ncbi:hypothetical protein IV42_GL001852 [Lentilactobacillus parabuchneri]|nr:hypothetical protein IV42_GL001852 [Lentilactobacillus parabuchneri]